MWLLFLLMVWCKMLRLLFLSNSIDYIFKSRSLDNYKNIELMLAVFYRHIMSFMHRKFIILYYNVCWRTYILNTILENRRSSLSCLKSVRNVLQFKTISNFRTLEKWHKKHLEGTDTILIQYYVKFNNFNPS